MKHFRQWAQYIIGLFVMSLGIVLIKQAGTGVSPISSIPSALTNVTGLSFGKTTIIFQTFCFVMILIIGRKIDLKTILIMPISVVFGYMIDMYMLFIAFDGFPKWACYIFCILGVAATALGIVCVVGTRLMLPSPDALMRTISQVSGQPLSRIKIAGDATWVVISVALELIFFRKVMSVWIGTVISVILTGRLVGIFGKYLKILDLSEKEKTQTRKDNGSNS